jgi:pimeloyl-ACP methyl ester carboxylesterase
VTEVEELLVPIDGAELHVLTAGDGFPVVLLHGFPELAYSWRHQLPALAAGGFRAIAPDQRGYGRSTCPDEVADYDLDHLCGDVLGLLDALALERAVVVGHDWGSGVAWALAQRHPDRVAGVVGVSGSFIPRADRPPTDGYRATFAGKFFYILYFQQLGPADAELNRDIPHTVRSIFAGDTPEHEWYVDDGRGFLERIPVPTQLPTWLTEEDLDVYVREFSVSGFTGPLNWYRNLDRNWDLSERYADMKIEVPSLFVAGANDAAVALSPPSDMDGWVLDHRGDVLIEGAGHWVQQERPGPVSDALIEFTTTIAHG